MIRLRRTDGEIGTEVLDISQFAFGESDIVDVNREQKTVHSQSFRILGVGRNGIPTYKVTGGI